MTALVRHVPMRQRGDTVARAGRWIACVTGLALFVGLVAPGPRRMHCCFGGTKGDVARETVQKYVYDAFPDWKWQHPGVACPTFQALDEYMNNKDSLDPWGQSYELLCDPSQGYIYVRSVGEDGKVGTADDLWITNAH